MSDDIPKPSRKKGPTAGPSLHKTLSKLVQNLPTDFEPYGERSREEWGPDCSCGCKFFQKLEGKIGMDWGVCSNTKSPRAGLLTFEHQGCKKFKPE